MQISFAFWTPTNFCMPVLIPLWKITHNKNNRKKWKLSTNQNWLWVNRVASPQKKEIFFCEKVWFLGQLSNPEKFWKKKKTSTTRLKCISFQTHKFHTKPRRIRQSTRILHKIQMWITVGLLKNLLWSRCFNSGWNFLWHSKCDLGISRHRHMCLCRNAWGSLYMLQETIKDENRFDIMSKNLANSHEWN